MKKQPPKMRKFLLWLIPLLILLNVGMLVWDYIDGESIVLDVVLIVIMIALYIFMICTPKWYRYIASRSYKVSFTDKETCSVYMDENECTVSFSKDGKEVAKEVLVWTDLTNYMEDNARIVLMFNLKFVVLRKEFLRGELDLLLVMMNQYIENNKNRQ